LTTATVWLFIFVAAYWSYCIFWGIKGARSAKTASDYFIAGRTIPIWVFVLAATATSFSGWTFMGHPDLYTVMVSSMHMHRFMPSRFLLPA